MRNLKAKTCSRLPEPRQGSALFLLSWAAYATAYIGRYNYSAVMGAITGQGTLTLSQAGMVSTGYFICYALGQIFCGSVSQYISPYTMIFTGLVLSGCCNLAMGVIAGGTMSAVWALNGLFQAMIWPPIVRLFAESMPLEQQKSACVNINATTPAGTLAAYLASAALLKLAGWRSMFLFCGGLMLAMAAIWLVGTVPLRRATVMQVIERSDRSGQVGNHSARTALAAAGLGWMLLPVVLHGGLKDGVTSWVPSMIQNSFGVSPSFSATVAAVLPLVNLTGAFGAGWLDRKIFHNEPRTVGALFSAAAVCLLVLPLAVRYSLAGSVALLAVTTASMLGINTMFINVIPVRVGAHGGAAMISGMLNAMTYFGAAAVTWGIGSIAEGFGWNAVFMLCLGMTLPALIVCYLLANNLEKFFARTGNRRCLSKK